MTNLSNKESSHSIQSGKEYRDLQGNNILPDAHAFSNQFAIKKYR